jgi:hypothetical protein
MHVHSHTIRRDTQHKGAVVSVQTTLHG